MSSESNHVEALRRGPRSWNQWRAQNPSTTPNLTGIALSASERQMGPINGGPMNFSFTRLRHASLRFATLTRANLEMADLSGADLSDARLDGANLSGADLCEALCERADFADAKLGGANLAAANLKDARNLTQAQIDEALGDAMTVLPAHLARPAGWGGGAAQVMSGLETRNGRLQGEANGKPAPTRGDTVSWLIGGPRRSDGRSALPQAEPAYLGQAFSESRS